MTSPAETLALCEKLDALLEKATPGEWTEDEAFSDEYTLYHENCALIAAMKNALPALLRAAREGVEARKALTEIAQTEPYEANIVACRLVQIAQSALKAPK